MNIFEDLNISIDLVLIGALVLILILFIMLVIVLRKQSKLNKKYTSFMVGKDGNNLEEAILQKFRVIDNLQLSVSDINKHLDKVDINLNTVYQKMGIVKYDAFKDAGGKMSFILALLTKENNGFIMNCMHSSREGCYTYMKEIVKGEAFVILSEEESQALEEAKNNRSMVK